MQLLRFILLLIVIYYLVRLVLRLVFPYIFQRYINKKTGNYSDRRRSSRQKTGKEGKVTIDFIDKKEKKISKDKGEYIDFKEVK